MTGKLTIQEIARVLMDKHQLSRQDASRFATEMFAVVLRHLQTGDMAKVKGLGTFKIISVEARESVSVRTGERVVIDSHSKVSFTPDTVMKELVNKPFSQFDTVMLNDGVAFGDTEVTVAEERDDETGETQEAGETPAPAVEEEAPIVEEEAPIVEEETPIVEEETPVVEEAPAVEEHIQPPHRHRWIAAVLAVLVLMALSAFGGYRYGLSRQVVLADRATAPDADKAARPAPRPERQPEPVAEHQDSVVQQQPAETQPSAEQSRQQAQSPQTAESSQPEGKSSRQEARPDVYEAKDDRVRLGAYRIVGTECEVVVREGQTFRKICKAYLGPDMECYVEVYNDLPRDPMIKTGQVIKIPKLQWKRKRK